MSDIVPMRKLLVVPILWMAISLVGYGRGTELYIPLGQSPGVSKEGKSVIGTVVWLEYEWLVPIMCLQQGADTAAVTCFSVKKSLPIYVDNSHIRQINRVGSWDDLQIGQTVEAYKDHWIKIKGGMP